MTALPVDDPARIDVRITTSAEDCSVAVHGEVDSSTAPGLRDCLLEVLERPGLSGVRVDLSQVTFLDSAGLSALAVAHRAAVSAGRTMTVRCGTARAVVRPLQITGLWDVFAVVDV
ncbi:anti-sigma B factor antagonist [Modestobacter sp. DSM 44400]|uniref:STAS domain-containing protein n=1 Tax=Modestobacter sp. DSM 44400 TaxID=1550230 RepID=UPI0008996FF6|nr:STAS domain-containing protein [Modestobacter sp. DSM 44400]SDX75817.1 anti-sigma B factor antagonist [Modestobacter sp. DSM 44400]